MSVELTLQKKESELRSLQAKADSIAARYLEMKAWGESVEKQTGQKPPNFERELRQLKNSEVQLLRRIDARKKTINGLRDRIYG